MEVRNLPDEVTKPCDHPSTVIATVTGHTIGSDEIRLGRLGDALIECGKEKEIAVEAYENLADTIR